MTANDVQLRRQKRRLQFVTLSLDIGGTEQHLVQLSTALAKRGWPISVFCFNKLGVNADRVRDSGVEVIGPPFEANLARTPRVQRLGMTALGAARLGWHLARTRPQIAQFWLGEAYIAGAPMALLNRTPILLMSRRSLNLYQRHVPGSAGIERRLHRRMTGILGNSRKILDELEHDESCDPKKLGLIYNGVDLEKFEPVQNRAALRERLGLPTDALIATIVANLNVYKGHADLMDALARVAGELPQPWLLLCVGGDTGRQAVLEAQVQSLNLSRNVRFLGARQDVPDLLAASDMGILCSHEEGFANAIVEGMAAGLPMIVTNVGGNAEAVVDEVTGLIVPAKDPQALGAAVLRLSLDEGLRLSLGAAGLARAHKLFSIETCVDRYAALYTGLLEGKTMAEIPEVAPRNQVLEVAGTREAPTPNRFSM